MSDMDLVLSRLSGVRTGFGHCMALCPVHKDTHPSLKVSQRDDGTVDLHCFAGCESLSVWEALGLDPNVGRINERAGNPSEYKGLPLIAHYRYTDQTGHLLFTIGRTPRDAQGEKHFPAWQPGPGPQQSYTWGLEGVERVLYQLPKVREAANKGRLIFVVEGEKDADSLLRHGLCATTNPHGAGKWREDYSMSLKGASLVVVLPDNDAAGRSHAGEVTGSLRRAGIPHVTLALPDLPEKGDVSDWLAAGGAAQELERMAVGLAESEPAEATNNGPVLVCMADVEARDVEWLWPQRIPQGMLTLIAGDPGLGKSYLALGLAATLSRGTAWPDLEPCSGPAASVILTAEDALAQTVRPRLDALGADVRLIHALQACRDEQGDHPILLSRDLPQLREAITRTHARLVIVDPLNAYLGGIDTHKAAEVRGVLADFSRLAEETGAAVVVVHHLNKGGVGSNPLYRATGSLDFVAAVRAYHVVAADPDDEERRLFLSAKMNLCRQPDGLAYRVCASGVSWDVEPVLMSAKEALSTTGNEDMSALEGAESFLSEQLADGPVLVNDLRARARDARIADRTLDRAKKSLGAVSQKGGYPGAPWSWSLHVVEVAKNANIANMTTEADLAPLALFERKQSPAEAISGIGDAFVVAEL